jgi:hypothetical protein
MESLNFVWQEIYMFFSQWENIISILLVIYGLAWSVILLELFLLPHKIKCVKLNCRKKQGYFFEGDGFFIRIRTIKVSR